MSRSKSIWLSHSSINTYLNCSRAYYLQKVYRSDITGNTIKVINPHLTVGSVVHAVLADISILNAGIRFNRPLSQKYELKWAQYSGKKGGFINKVQEEEFKERGRLIIQNIEENPGILKNPAVKIRSRNAFPPSFNLTEEIVLCGSVDWVEYLPDNTIHIIDFKTGKEYFDKDSLQLPIYYLIAKNLQNRKISKMSYWYIEISKEPTEVTIPAERESTASLIKIGNEIIEYRNGNDFLCKKGGCRDCLPYDAVLKGEAELVDSDGKYDTYFLNF